MVRTGGGDYMECLYLALMLNSASYVYKSGDLNTNTHTHTHTHTYSYMTVKYVAVRSSDLWFEEFSKVTSRSSDQWDRL